MDITIGKPIANTQIYILDDRMRPVPIGIPGEICIAGEGVGMGYLNRPELTQERFVMNPYATDENKHGRTLYRTGDLGRWRVDGDIEILGRIDTQIKIRGLRIEPGEIESMMSSFEGIYHTAVVAKRSEEGRQYLIGYYTAKGIIDESKLREHLATKLPQYMIPNYFLHLETMPMTASGKTDRKNLPEPDLSKSIHEYIAPQTKTEKSLATIWQKLLRVNRVGREDDFFELGGDSLLAISMSGEISNAFNKSIPVKDIFENALLKKLANTIDYAEAKYVNHIRPANTNKYELLPQQKAIYAVCAKERSTLKYNVPAKLSIPESIDRLRLKQIISKIVAGEKDLNTYIIEEGNTFYGVYDKNATITFEEYDEYNQDSFLRPFDLSKAPLVHVGFTKDALLFDVHHIVADGTTLSVLIQKIATHYAENTMEPDESELWYGDYSDYYRSLSFDEPALYFKDQLKCEFVPVKLPENKNDHEGGASAFFEIPDELFGKVKGFAHDQGYTETMVFLGAYGILLSKYTGNKDVLSSIIFQNRIMPDIKTMSGMFVNTLPVYFRVEGMLHDYFQKVKHTVLNMYQYQEMPFLEIADAVGMKDRSVINTAFVYQGEGEITVELDGCTIVPEFIETKTSKFDLTMELTPARGECHIRMEYNCAKYSRKLIDRLVQSYLRILEQMNVTDRMICDVNVLSESELYAVTEGFNNTYVNIPKDRCVHELFMEQARKTPDKTALVFEDMEFTFRELDNMSDAFAKKIQKAGGGREK